MALIRISPDGKEVVCLHNDFIHKIISKHSDVVIKRASDVFYDNKIKMWRVRILEPYEELLPLKFFSREEALEFEKRFLEDSMTVHGSGI